MIANQDGIVLDSPLTNLCLPRSASALRCGPIMTFAAVNHKQDKLCESPPITLD